MISGLIEKVRADEDHIQDGDITHMTTELKLMKQKMSQFADGMHRHMDTAFGPLTSLTSATQREDLSQLPAVLELLTTDMQHIAKAAEAYNGHCSRQFRKKNCVGIR